MSPMLLPHSQQSVCLASFTAHTSSRSECSPRSIQGHWDRQHVMSTGAVTSSVVDVMVPIPDIVSWAATLSCSDSQLQLGILSILFYRDLSSA
jgi:hypothetical protein